MRFICLPHCLQIRTSWNVVRECIEKPKQIIEVHVNVNHLNSFLLGLNSTSVGLQALWITRHSSIETSGRRRSNDSDSESVASNIQEHSVGVPIGRIVTLDQAVDLETEFPVEGQSRRPGGIHMELHPVDVPRPAFLYRCSKQGFSMASPLIALLHCHGAAAKRWNQRKAKRKKRCEISNLFYVFPQAKNEVDQIAKRSRLSSQSSHGPFIEREWTCYGCLSNQHYLRAW